MIDPRLILAAATSKTLTSGIRMIGRGGGTALPGLFANRIDPRILDKLAARLPEGAVIVAGTNGKTTTSRMLAGMLEAAGRQVAHNRAGSNLVRGISSALAEQMPLFGAGKIEIGVIETDENALPDVIARVQPRAVLLLNLFRDQLDRYGELETITAAWQRAVEKLPATTVLIINADDPNLVSLSRRTAAQVVTFGLAEPGYDLPELPHASDASICRVCETPLTYDALYLSHLGAFRCPTCGMRRPPLDFSARAIVLDGVRRSSAIVRDASSEASATEMEVEISVPGLYNVYNGLAAIAAARILRVPVESALATLRSFQAAFGRLERIQYAGRHLTLALAKNPVGFNEVLRMITNEPLAGPIVIGINDLYADGTDVSWLWDVDFEVLADQKHQQPAFAAGIRGHDLAVRLKYAGVPDERNIALAAGLPLSDALDRIIERTNEGQEIFVLLTYTAMLQLRQGLADRGVVAEFWKQ
jgi:lipid II isoglutaminyl synthase (glutamine-hydrolysing)